MPGCAVSGGRRWDLGDAGIPIRVTYHIEVTANGLLSILPGTTLLFDKTQYSTPTYLIVQDQAALYALGTATQPIVFTGATQTPGWWSGIEANNESELILNHCEIGFGGGGSTTSLEIRWGLSERAGSQHPELRNPPFQQKGRSFRLCQLRQHRAHLPLQQPARQHRGSRHQLERAAAGSAPTTTGATRPARSTPSRTPAGWATAWATTSSSIHG